MDRIGDGVTPDHWLVRLARKRERLALANVALLLLWLLAALAAYRHLPDAIPVHFTLAGAPTRWEPTALGWWLALPLVAVGLWAFFPLMERLDDRLNAGYRAGPSASGDDALARRLRRTYMDLAATLLIGALALLHAGTWLVATRSSATLPPVVIALALASFVAMLLLLIPLQRATRLAARRP
jgi:uncharacterized membrane protein